MNINVIHQIWGCSDILSSNVLSGTSSVRTWYMWRCAQVSEALCVLLFPIVLSLSLDNLFKFIDSFFCQFKSAIKPLPVNFYFNCCIFRIIIPVFTDIYPLLTFCTWLGTIIILFFFFSFFLVLWT